LERGADEPKTKLCGSCQESFHVGDVHGVDEAIEDELPLEVPDHSVDSLPHFL